MKIGILTLPLHTNYGGILQAYALQTVLERMGHDVKVLSIDTWKKQSITSMLIRLPIRIFRRLLGSKADILSEYHYNHLNHTIHKNVEPTLNRKIHRDKRQLNSIEEHDYDAFVVGSDQIWRPQYIQSVLQSTVPNAYLAFAKDWNVKRVAYAASFGTEEWEYTPEQTVLVSELAKKFDAVSVREIDGLKLCSEHLSVEATHVLDPTLLLSKEDYIRSFDLKKEPLSEGDLMVYILDFSKEKNMLIERIAKERGLKSFTVGAKIEDSKAPIEERIQPKLEKWLRGFMDAKFIITDSFHACVFSIIFNKPFLVVGNKKRGMSRFKSLLSMFSLEKNCICSMDEYDSQYPYEVSSGAYSVLKDKTMDSISFLKDNLK